MVKQWNQYPLHYWVSNLIELPCKKQIAWVHGELWRLGTDVYFASDRLLNQIHLRSWRKTNSVMWQWDVDSAGPSVHFPGLQSHHDLELATQSRLDVFGCTLSNEDDHSRPFGPTWAENSSEMKSLIRKIIGNNSRVWLLPPSTLPAH